MTDGDFNHRLATEWLYWLFKDGRCYNSALAIYTAGSVASDCANIALLITQSDRNSAWAGSYCSPNPSALLMAVSSFLCSLASSLYSGSSR